MSNLGNINFLTENLLSRWRLLLGEVMVANSASLPSTTIEGMKELHNKLALTVLTQERYLLAVTGLQSAS